MKRRLEETVKAPDSSGGYPHPSSPLSPPPSRHPPRTLPTVNQPTYAPAVKPAGELRSVQGFSTYPTTMPAITPTLKPVVTGGLQGGAQTLTNIHTMQTLSVTPIRKIHNQTMTPSATTVTTAQQQQQIQRLKVEDALSYLDMVKFKFGDQPQVYNDFLDIMKEFKSQSIDTPGVIERVSSLFNGHPELIVGFNTFLPPGYKIEVKTSEQGYSFQVQVSMPSPSAATTTMVPAAPVVHHHLPTTTMPAAATTKPLMLSSTTIVSHGSTTAAVVPPLPPPVPATTPPHFPNHTTTSITQVQAHQAVSQALSHVDSPQPPTPSSQPVEFNHAINYVNKIKNRFQGQPDKYKRFLEILHTYQKEQRNLKEGVGSQGQATSTKQLTEAEVYSQVAKLFEHQEDLLAEFGQFLPDATNSQTQLPNSAQAVQHNNKSMKGCSTLSKQPQPPPSPHSQSILLPEVYYELQPQPPPTPHPRSILLPEFQPKSSQAMVFQGKKSSSDMYKPPPSPHPRSLLPPKFQPKSSQAMVFQGKKSSSGMYKPPPSPHPRSLLPPKSRRGEEPSSSLNRKPPINIKLASSYNNSSSASPSPSPVSSGGGPPVKLCTPAPAAATTTAHVEPSHSSQQGLKRSPSMTLHHAAPSTSHHSTQPPPAKKHKPNLAFRDVSLSEAAKFGTLTDFAFFDKVRKALRSQEVYDNFLRCINLYTQEVVSRAELLQLATPFLGRFPELFRWFKEYIGHADGPPVHLASSINSPNHHPGMGGDNLLNNNRPERPTGELSDIHTDFDFASCKRLGASYCALPKNSQQQKCSGRTSLCREVLNDTWVSFPTWSEESTFVTSRKTTYEEYIYRCEDERFELDLVLEVNSGTIRVLEGVHKKLCRMSTEEVAKYHLDDCLGGSSPTIQQRALVRVYGEKAPEIIDGLKKNPVVAVPVVLRRLKAKDEEWREAQKSFNKVWRDLNEKYYLKSLDHQGINFKQNDMKALRSKSLFNEIETCYDERHEQVESGDPTALPGPHMSLPYKDKSVLDDAANLLIHHVKRQTSIHKDDKQRIKHMLRVLLPDLFHHPRQELSEDERDPADDKSGAPNSPSAESGTNKSRSEDKTRGPDNEDVKLPIHALSNHPSKSSQGRCRGRPRKSTKGLPYIRPPTRPPSPFLPFLSKECKKRASTKNQDNKEEAYTLFFGNGNWYLFFRLHQILCDRLTHINEQANVLIQEESKFKELRSDSAAQSLRLKPKCEFLVDVELEDYYTVFLDMVKNVLDGNMDSNTYEDTLREMFGIHAYLAFTLDKVVIYAVRQLQHLVSDEACTECADLYLKANSRAGAGGPCVTAHLRAASEAAYQRKAEIALTEENCFKIFIYKIDCKCTIELLEGESDGDENDTSNREAEKWSAYVERYSKSEKEKDDMELDEEEQERRMWGKAIFLPRNVRLWQERVANNKNKIPPKIDSCDETECKFNLNSYKMVFVLDRESYLYKRQALLRAKQSHKKLSLRMSTKFHVWHQNWARTHLTVPQYDFASEWMMGNLPDYRPNHTVVLTNNPLDKPPYRSYNRYRVVSNTVPKKEDK